MYLFMEIKPNLVNNNMRLNSYETNTQGNIHVIPRREFLHHISNEQHALRNFNNILKSGPAKFGHQVAHRHVMHHGDYISNKENIDPNIQ